MVALSGKVLSGILCVKAMREQRAGEAPSGSAYLCQHPLP